MSVGTCSLGVVVKSAATPPSGAAQPAGREVSASKINPSTPRGWRTREFAELHTDIREVVGDKTAKALLALKVRTVGDLLRHVPRRYLSGTESTDFSTLVPGEEVAIVATVAGSEVLGADPRCRCQVELTDGHRSLSATFFGRRSYMDSVSRQLPRGARGIFVGKVGAFNGHPQLGHPDYVRLDSLGKPLPKGRTAEERAQRATMFQQVQREGLVGLYPATRSLPTWNVAEAVALALDHVGELRDPLPAWLVEGESLMSQIEAFRGAHQPETRDQAEAAIDRLRFDEAISLQLVMARRRARAAADAAPALAGRPGGLLDQFDARLPYQLTAGQREVGGEIFDELARPRPMQRLLQGEVGSGKTLVALRAMLRAVDSGCQAVLVAPTEVLAMQHAQSIRALLGELGEGVVLGAPDDATEVVLLTGSLPTAARKAALLKIAGGEAGIVIGTHALFSDKVMFARLGLVVVDEQHRFGVEQRATLLAQGRLAQGSDGRPHQLVMTATPIPRSIAMTVFGDLETSTLTEIPAGRSPVQTTVVGVYEHPTWLERAWQRIREEVTQGRQAFVVVPRIDPGDAPGLLADSDPSQGQPEVDEEGNRVALPMTSLVEAEQYLRDGPLAGLRLGVLHGRLPRPEDKDAVMSAFAGGELDVLLSTTVVEVGVDVPNASVMVILDADRFGVSQLHQLRGRIGRGEHPGLCLLVTGAADDTLAMQRLRAVASTRDGFKLAELDLAQRREGNVLGAAQAGAQSSLRLLRVLDDADLIAHARQLAERLVADDPDELDDFLVDIVTSTEQLSAGEWLERT